MTAKQSERDELTDYLIIIMIMSTGGVKLCAWNDHRTITGSRVSTMMM